MKVKWFWVILGGFVLAVGTALELYVRPYVSAVTAVYQLTDSIDSSAIGRLSTDVWSWLPILIMCVGVGMAVYGVFSNMTKVKVKEQ